VDCLELLGPAEELVAVRAGKSRRLGMPFEQGIESTARTAVGVGDEHGAVPVCSRVEQRFELGDDALRAIVQVGGEIHHLDRIGEALGLEDGAQLRRECSTGDDEGRDSHAVIRCLRPPRGRVVRPSIDRDAT